MRSTKLRTTLLASGAAIALAAIPGAAAADDLQSLRDQLQKLQSKVAKIEADRAQKSRKVAAAAAVEAGSKPKSWKLPGTNTSMVIGGYVKLDLIWSFGGAAGFANAQASTGIPGTAADNAGNGGDFNIHARQSRLFVRTWTPTDWGELTTLIEGDFFAGGNFRLRHAWGCLGPVCAGQTWSTYMPVWSGYEALNFGAAWGGNFTRRGQIRFTHAFGGGWVFQAAIEDPRAASDAKLASTGSTADAGAAQEIPVFVLALSYSAKWGRIWVGAQATQAEYDTGGAGGLQQDDKELNWSVTIAGAFVITSRLRAGFSAGIGQGNDIQAFGGGNVANVITPTGSLESVLQYGGYVWVQWRWTDTIRSNFAFDYAAQEVHEEVANRVIPAATVYRAWGTHVNLIWSPVPAVNIGIEYIYVFSDLYGGGTNDQAHIVQVSFQYKF